MAAYEQTDEETRGLVLAAASSANAGVLALIEGARGDIADLAAKFETEETAEQLADALQTVLTIELGDGDVGGDRPEMIGQLLAAIRRFLDGWA